MFVCGLRSEGNVLAVTHDVREVCEHKFLALKVLRPEMAVHWNV